MKRVLQRHVLSAVNATWDPTGRRFNAGTVAVLLTFPGGSFPKAPTWSPGEGFRVCLEDKSWIEETPERITMVVTDVVRPLRAVDDERPAGSEVWTVTVPVGTAHLGFLWDKPYKITGQGRVPGAEVARQPVAEHPSADVCSHWAAFERQWGFRPRLYLGDGSTLPGGARWLLLTCTPGYPHLPNELELIEAAALVARRFGARARVYRYDPVRGTTADPTGGRGDVETVRRILEAAARRL